LSLLSKAGLTFGLDLSCSAELNFTKQARCFQLSLFQYGHLAFGLIFLEALVLVWTAFFIAFAVEMASPAANFWLADLEVMAAANRDFQV
jgi:hypothetical protein